MTVLYYRASQHMTAQTLAHDRQSPCAGASNEITARCAGLMRLAQANYAQAIELWQSDGSRNSPRATNSH